ncbi:MAG: glycosyltransferase [Candidatus Aminicenantes bacterium]|nr:glycosyltransferase [Candidatus Aminicenantes bacterium]
MGLYKSSQRGNGKGRLLRDITVVITAFERPEKCLACIKSIRQYYPDIEIIISDNGRRRAWPRNEIIGRYKCRYLKLPFDCGTNQAKNKAFDRVKTKYIVTCPDDFEFIKETKLENFKAILDSVPDIGMACGSLREDKGAFGAWLEINRKKAYYLIDRIKNPAWQKIGDVRYAYADYSYLFGMLRNEPDIRFDPDLKIGIGHLDFMLQLKLAGKWKLAFTPDVIADRSRRPDSPEYNKYRTRGEFARLFYEKTGLRYGIIKYKAKVRDLKYGQTLYGTMPQINLYDYIEIARQVTKANVK